MAKYAKINDDMRVYLCINIDNFIKINDIYNRLKSFIKGERRSAFSPLQKWKSWFDCSF